MPRLRVVYFVSNYHRFTGSQKSLYLLLRGLAADQVEAHVVFPGEGKCTAAYRDAGISVEVLEPPAELDAFGGGLLRAGPGTKAQLFATQVVPYALRFAAVLRERRADVAHFNNTRSILLAGLGARVTRTPSVWHIRGDERSLGPLTTAAALLADRAVCVADGVQSTVPAAFRSKAVTIYNGIDAPGEGPSRQRTELMAAMAPPLQLTEDDVLMVAVGSIVPFKGLHHLLDACAHLGRERPALARRLVVVLVGDEPVPEYGRLLHGLAGDTDGVRIRFAGWSDAPLDWMRAADAVVLPTVEKETLILEGAERTVHGTEGFSRSVLEAMACSRLVIATRVAGVPEQVVDGATGLLCPPSDPSSLARCLAEVVAMTPERREEMGRAGRNRVLEHFPVRRTVTETVALYRRLAGG